MMTTKDSLLELDLKAEGVRRATVGPQKLLAVEVSTNGNSRAGGPVLLEGKTEAELLVTSKGELVPQEGIGSVLVLGADGGSGASLVGEAVDGESGGELDIGGDFLREGTTNDVAVIGIVEEANKLPERLEVASLGVPEEARSSLLLSLGVGGGEVHLTTKIDVLVGTNSGSLDVDGLGGSVIRVGDSRLDSDVLILEVRATLNRGTSLALVASNGELGALRAEVLDVDASLISSVGRDLPVSSTFFSAQLNLGSRRTSTLS